MLNETHNPDAQSWVEAANAPGTDFPLQNLPFGSVRLRGSKADPRVGVAIGDAVLDVTGCAEAGVLEGRAAEAAAATEAAGMNGLLALGRAHWSALRLALHRLLNASSPDAPRHQARIANLLMPMRDAEMMVPCHIGDYSDFYASVFHATNVGSMFRPDNPLLPNYKYVPIGYHGRASSIVVSGTPVRRPRGQSRPDGSDRPAFGPTRRLDYELEVGAIVGPGNDPGDAISLDRIEEHLFGLCLVNDWSARDMQAWEYQPLGPFLAKSFATTVSPWIVTFDALKPFRVPPFPRPHGDPAPLPYLDAEWHRARGGADVRLEVWLWSSRMRAEGLAPVRLSQSNLRDMYWTFAQMATHHASNGCNLRPGDLLASGTVSGPAQDQRGCLLELSWRGSDPIELPTGETRAFLQDGDEVILTGCCEREGAGRIGFGECRGLILPA